MNLTERVRETCRMLATPAVLSPMQAGYLRDMVNGAEYSLRYSPYAIRVKILGPLLAQSCIVEEDRCVDGVWVKMCVATARGKEAIVNG